MSKIMVLVGLVALCLLASCGLLLTDEQPLTQSERAWVHREGELLMAAAHCDACHQADEAILDRLAPAPAPNLAGIGWRASPHWLRDWVTSPHSLRPSTRMPDVLAGFDADKRASIADDITHYLMTLGGGFTVSQTRDDDWDVPAGEQLFSTLGCRACHADGVDGALASKTDLPTLAGFLADPTHTRPAGLMPHMQLSDDESMALAAWLLREQFANGPTEVLTQPGLQVLAYEFRDGPEQLPDFSELKPVRVGIAQRIDVSPATRSEQFGLVFEGEVHIAATGDVRLFTESDDGSRLWIGEQLVVDNDGLHGAQLASGSIALDAGWQPLRVEMFEAGGDEVLVAGFLDENDEPQPFTTSELRHTALRYDPLDHRPETPDSWKATWGRIWFQQLRCASCHELPGVTAKSAPALAELADLADGCLSETVPKRLPDYRFNPDERQALRDVLAHRRSLALPLKPTERVERTMEQLACLSCHARGSHRGPTGDVRAAFTSTADLGDEGRLPPDLTAVGRRLRPDWLHKVISEGTNVRPTMQARMPRFGQTAAALIAALPAADGAPPNPPTTQATVAAEDSANSSSTHAARDVSPEELISAGRELVGSGGLSCIACHDVAGHSGPSLPGIDLALTTRRLTRQAFDLWMAEPLAQRPGTRMPSYYEGDRSMLTTVLDGDAQSQIDALWAYLSLGDELPLPVGLVVDRASYELLPIDRPRLVALFMEGLSARVLAVGYPERISLAFDLANVRLGKIWRGDFLNLEGTWRGRAGQLQQPGDVQSRDLPPGPALGRADEQPWPENSARAAGWRMSGHRRDEHGQPTFLYGRDGVTVEESYTPLIAAEGGRIVRHFTLRGNEAEQHVLRAAVAEQITSDDQRRFVCADGLTVIVHAGEASVRTTPHGAELLIAPVPMTPDGLTLKVELNW